MKKLLVAVVVVMGFASVSNAGLLLEPYLGYEMGTFKDNAEGKMDGTLLGARIAWTAPVMFWAGLDYSTTVSAKFKSDTSGVPDSDAKRNTLYAVVGVDFPILLRAWLGYGLMNEIKFSDYNNKLKGKSTKLGVSFTGLPFICLNLEYLMESFDEQDRTPSGLSPEAKNTAYVLSVSLPWEF